MRPNDYAEYIGFLKYKGKAVEGGLLDIRKAADALSGFDSALRFFIKNEGVADLDFEMPVKIREGSWEVLIPQTLAGWVGTGTGVVVTTYAATAAKKLAENDFKDVTLVELVSRSIKQMQRVIEISKRLGAVAKKSLRGITWLNNNQLVSIQTPGGTIQIPQQELQLYLQTPSDLFDRIAQPIEKDRLLEIGFIEAGRIRTIEIGFEDKHIFYTDETDAEEIFPELKDGDIVTIEGKITKGNERTNAIGVEYKGLILNCHPEKGTVVKYKQYLFTICKVTGVVDRTRSSHDKKPQIIIMSIESKTDDRSKLF